MTNFTIGMSVGSQPPISRIRTQTRIARLTGFDAAWTVDHFMGFFPQSLWDHDFSWLANPKGSPHRLFEYQALLGNLAAHAGKVRLGIGVTETIRRHPVLVAQTAMTLAHVAKAAPIIGIGAGPHVDGQVLVLHDMLGITQDFKPRFLRQYADLNETITGVVKNYVTDIKKEAFPNEKESY